MECGLCYQPFKATDEVYNCSKLHIFHVKCYEESQDIESDDDGELASALKKADDKVF